METDLDTWADAYIRSSEMTAKSWDEARQTAYLGVPSEAVWRARALLRARDRVIAGYERGDGSRVFGLSGREKALLRQIIDRPTGPLLNPWAGIIGAMLLERGLITKEAVATPLGHEIAAELQRRASSPKERGE